MTKSIFSKQYDLLRELLITARQRNRLTQAQVAAKLNKPQSFVSKYERGERRLDVVEFLNITRALDVDPSFMIERIELYDEEHKENILEKGSVTHLGQPPVEFRAAIREVVPARLGQWASD